MICDLIKVKWNLECAGVKMDNNKLAKLLFPDVEMCPDDMELRFPARNINCNSCVTRIGPSPTGFVHLGNLYNAIVAERLAHQSDGIFYLRIEDTDNKRKIEGAVDVIIDSMAYFDVRFDEGAVADGDKGIYGPYRQRQRRDIYHVFAKHLVERGLAYPCFLTAVEIDAIREQQTVNKENTGIYGDYAKYRNLDFDEVKKFLDEGREWVLRYKGTETNEYIEIEDAIRGKLEMPRNNMDFVLLKSDGIPTYHFAHVVDDHLMRSTHIIRGEEWLSSLPMHVELFNVLGWKQPVYCHTATLMKIDEETGGKRKLSKRKDPELALSYYQQEGICSDAIWEFLLTVLNSNYEEWRIANPTSLYTEFPFSLKKMSISGALFDMEKLNSISKDVIGKMNPGTVFSYLKDWSSKYNLGFNELIRRYPERTLKALGVGKNIEKARKDFVSWKQTCEFLAFYYDELFTVKDEMPSEITEADRKEFFKLYIRFYSHVDDQQEWFAKVKKLADSLGYAVKVKDYKKNPELFKGSIVHVTNMLRIALTGMANAPDIWEVSHVLGEEVTMKRLNRWV